ncbi:MAG: formylglycine-generating enzyme family protein, partial [Spirochaetales bacterium]|nr:formylglycine-generating enzyme family protein [Spirochaetales bacterium]
PPMVLVEGGVFSMGDKTVESNQPRQVKLSSFYMSLYLVTIAEWKEFLGDTGLEFTWDWEGQDGYGPFYNIVPSETCPAQGLNWYYAVVYCNWASRKDGLAPAYRIDRLPEGEFTEISVHWDKGAEGYRLPTDAEWEYAARGGEKSEGFLYPGSNDPAEIGRFGNEYKSSYPVGQYKPNELGIYDLGGNASEWCWDWYDEVMYEWLPAENPSVDLFQDIKEKSIYRHKLKVRRGAAWNSGPRESFRRGGYQPQNISMTGIRLVRNAQ